jgi:hypothetical protein
MKKYSELDYRKMSGSEFLTATYHNRIDVAVALENRTLGEKIIFLKQIFELSRKTPSTVKTDDIVIDILMHIDLELSKMNACIK